MSGGMALFYRFQVCSQDFFLIHIRRNQKCCDKLCHFGAYTHMNNFSYNAVLRRYSGSRCHRFLSISRDKKNYEKVAQMCQNNEHNKIFIRKNYIFDMGKYYTVFQIQL